MIVEFAAVNAELVPTWRPPPIVNVALPVIVVVALCEIHKRPSVARPDPPDCKVTLPLGANILLFQTKSSESGFTARSLPETVNRMSLSKLESTALKSVVTSGPASLCRIIIAFS